MTSAPGRAATSGPGSRSLEPRIPEPMMTCGCCTTAASMSTATGRQADRRDAAVLHAGRGQRVVHRRERRLAGSQPPPDDAVHVRPGDGGHQARRVTGLATAPGRDDHAVRGLLRRDAIVLAERHGVGEIGIDRSDLDLVAARAGPFGEGRDNWLGQQFRMRERGLQVEVHGPIQAGRASWRGCLSRFPGRSAAWRASRPAAACPGAAP